MSRTFEELASQQPDALYQGALFLSGGLQEGAKRLLVDAITLAFGRRRDFALSHAPRGGRAKGSGGIQRPEGRLGARHARRNVGDAPAGAGPRR